jgi:RNA polymerase sigma-70 factor (ECF subfamily)
LTATDFGKLLRRADFSHKVPGLAATIFPAMARQDTTQRGSEPDANQVDWPALLAQHGRWLRTVVLARVGEAAAADDVLQEVAAAAIEKGHQLRSASSAAPWLYRLAVMAALQYRRRQGRRRKLLDRYVERHMPHGDEARDIDPLDWLLADERKALVRKALARLPRRDAEILLLKYTEDWSYRELAQHLGLTTSAVEARLHRARQKMRKALAAVDPSLVAAREQ